MYERFVHERVDGYEVIVAEPFENRHLLARIPDFYERLKRSYDTKFYEQEVMGQYISLHAGLVYHAFYGRNTWMTWRRIRGCRCCGRWISTWIRCVRWWRRSPESE